MKKYVYILVALVSHAIIPCASPQSGQRVWNIATKNIFVTQAIESNLDIVSSIDTIAAFSDLDQLLDQVTIVQSKASLLVQEIDHLQSNIIEDLSQTQQIQSDIQVISSSLTLLDISSVFTALDALQTTIVSAMDLLNTDLEGIASNIDVITLSEVQYFQTVASQLDKLDDDVAMVNSLLDALSEQFSLTTFDSVTDLMQQDLVSLESNVDVLADQLEGGFEDTFGILDQNMLLAQTVASQTDNLDVMDDADLTSTYSLLDQLEVSVQTIDSLTDLLIDAFQSIESTVDILGPSLDETVSKYMFIESRILLLVQEMQDTIIDPAVSRMDHATSLLDRDISLLEHAYTTDLPALTESIESKLDDIIMQQHEQLSDLDTIASIFDAITAIPNETTDISRLSFVNSLLDDTIDDAFATESYIDPATRSEQLFVITDNAQNLQAQLSYVDLIVPQISSKMLLIDDLLATTDSTLDIINVTALNNVDDVIAIESITDTLSFIAQPSDSISSILDVISSQEEVVISKLTVASSLIAAGNSQAQGLIGDFQATWTILQSIDTKLAQAYSSLSFADAVINEKFVSYSSVFTMIDTIIANESTVNSQVDVYNSMVNVLTSNINIDFNGVFTALTDINSSTANSSNMLSVISSKLPIVQTELGFPIYARNLPLTITTPGRYYLAENITYLGGSAAITINTSNVSLDFNQRSIIGTPSVRAIDTATGLSNIAIFNGKTVNFAGIGIQTGATNIRLRDLVTIGGGNGYFGSGRNISVRNYRIINGGSSNAMLFQSHTNVDVTDCFFRNNQGVVMQLNTSNIVVSNCEFHSTNNCVLPNGSHSNVLIKNCRAMSPGFGVICAVTSLAGLDIVNNYFETTAAPAFRLQGSNGTIVGNTAINNTNGVLGELGFANSFIGFNNFIQNTSNNVRIPSGANTVLGNFAFNTNASGVPNNTNYNTSGSTTNMAGKFVTISQRTGISGSVAPTYWHNINMLP